MEINPISQCPSCHAVVSEAAYFCSNCGKPLKAQPESISIGRQIVVYLISFFLAPFGLFFAFKYLKHPDKKSRTIGMIIIALTIFAIFITLFTARVFLETIYQNIQIINI